jgi:hypothetical protein
MKQNKNRILNLRITESEFEAVHRLSKHYKRPIADLLRGYINAEDLKLLRNQQSQETIFKKSDFEMMKEANRELMAQLNLLSLSNSQVLSKKLVGKPVKKIAKVKNRLVSVQHKTEIKRKKGIKQNE